MKPLRLFMLLVASAVFVADAAARDPLDRFFNEVLTFKASMASASSSLRAPG